MRVQAPPRCKPVAIDDLVLRQVAENLVSNALKYAPESDIEISVRGSAPGFWQLLVEDRGPGIPAAHQRELFKPFTRLGEIDPNDRSEEHTSELQSLMRISYAVFCLKQKQDNKSNTHKTK